MIVEVAEGKLRGVVKRSSWDGSPYYAFLGIPYAKPPIDDLRFMAPVPIGKWDGILDAYEEGNQCLHIYPGSPRPFGSEDCLYLNVYSPKASSREKTKKAVMIWIHGGGFRGGSGSADYYGPDYLITHDVILVTLNYRLHIFGFLNTGTDNCCGNAGLRDQLLAIKWVKNNIASFGGDPENITLFGESAGGTSVHLQMLSPLSKGLFKRGILQSGNALSPWALQPDPEAQALKVGQLSGYHGEDLNGLVQYLKTMSARQLFNLAHQYHNDHIKEIPGICASVIFIPSVEKNKEGAFLPDLPENLMKSAPHVPSIFGFNDQDGLLVDFAHIPECLDLLVEDPSIAIRNNFHLDKSQQDTLFSEIQKFYFNNEQPGYQEIVNLYTDLYLMKFYDAIDYLIQSSTPPYVYLFAYYGTLNMTIRKLFGRHMSIKGAAHAEELGYLFSQKVVPGLEPGVADGVIIKTLGSLWTNFAKTGNPTSSLPSIDWKQHTDNEPCYMKLEKCPKVFNEKMFGERLDFWRKWMANFRLV